MKRIDASLAGKRLDIAAALVLEETRSVVKHWIDEQRLLVNGKPGKASQKVTPGDALTVVHKAPDVLGLTPVDLALDILYEDAAIAVINKPSGLTVHPASTTKEATLVHGILHQIKDLGVFDDVIRPGIVHRLDKDTSGCIVVAKTKDALLALQADLQARTVKRTYHALVKGHLSHEKGTIDAPIGRHPVNRKSMAITGGGKPSITHFQVLKTYRNASLIECHLETGRTHQIRVHLAHLGHPVLGDPKYGSPIDAVTGQLLHAVSLSLKHPTRLEVMTFKAPYPDDFKAQLNRLENELMG